MSEVAAGLARRGQMTGRAILVTGAAQGIGRAIAELFLAEGAQVAMLDRNANALLQAANSGSALPLICDLRDEQAINSAISTAAEKMGKIDGLVNAAGIYHAGAIADTSLETWREVMAVNLDAPFLLCRAAAPHLRNAPASTIVNIASGVGLQPFANRSAYATSKGGLITLGKVLAMELAPAVRVNTICPGLINTPMIASLPNHNALESILPRYALQRLGKAEEVAQAALYLSSPASSFVTGITMAVDGGRTFH